MPRRPKDHVPLPNAEGPKLGPFKYHHAAIDFHRLLSDGDSDTGGHAHVFEVSIKSAVYVLKIFKFYDDEEARSNLTPEGKQHVTVDLLHAHMDPFYNECRAYGKLVDAGLNGKLAVRCHGYMILGAEMEDELERKFSVTGWGRPAREYDKPVSKREPLRATVKDLIRADVEFEAKNVSKMLRDLKHILRLGVYPMDVYSRNYRAGLLLDFSNAITEPHYLFDTLPDFQVAMYKRDDLLLFDQMIEDTDTKTWVRATPNYAYMKKLRRRP